MNRRKQVLILAQMYPNSFNLGAASYVEDQFKAISKYSSWEVKVLAVVLVPMMTILAKKKLHFGLYKSANKWILQLPPVPTFTRLNNRIRNFLAKRLLSQYIQMHGKPDVIHVHTYLIGETALWAKRKYGIPYVITEHSTAFARGLIQEWQEKEIEAIYQNSNRNIAVSQQFADLLAERYQAPFEYVPNLVDTKHFSKLSSESCSEIFTFLNIAYADKKKNQAALIKAFAKRFRGHSVQLRIGGNGPELENLRQLIAESEIEEQVQLLGKLSREQVKEQMQQADCFVLPSLHETFGVVLIEAMSCGLPVVATKCGGPESIVTSSEVGILCDISEEAIGQAMEEVTKAKYKGETIREFVQKRFSNEAVVDRLNKIYERVVE